MCENVFFVHVNQKRCVKHSENSKFFSKSRFRKKKCVEKKNAQKTYFFYGRMPNKPPGTIQDTLERSVGTYMWVGRRMADTVEIVDFIFQKCSKTILKHFQNVFLLCPTQKITSEVKKVSKSGFNAEISFLVDFSRPDLATFFTSEVFFQVGLRTLVLI